MKKLGLLLSFFTLSIVSLAEIEPDDCPSSCTSRTGSNNGRCRPSTTSTGKVCYYCVDSYWWESNDCTK